jgi:tRNA(adenine34) deaminase
MLIGMQPDWVWDEDDRRFMRAAIDAAVAAGRRDEVPVGAVVVRRGRVIAAEGNRRRELGDPTAHAEVLAIRAAASISGDHRLSDCTLYVTLEPCPMCVTVCRQARLELVVWGADDPKAGACGSVIDLAADRRLGPALANRGGLEAKQGGQLLEDFFAKRRGKD